MGKFIDLTGQKFGRLTVTERAGSKNRRALWRCVCECGNEALVTGKALKDGHTKSCGCLKSEILRAAQELNTTHGMFHTRLYGIWVGIRKRCGCRSFSGYKNYGGRGITVCAEWVNSFETFRDWALANGYRDDLTLDRKENDGPYSPENCRWATKKEQANNRRTNHLLTYNGKTQNIKQWAESLGISPVTLSSRINRSHWDIEKALTTK